MAWLSWLRLRFVEARPVADIAGVVPGVSYSLAVSFTVRSRLAEVLSVGLAVAETLDSDALEADGRAIAGIETDCKERTRPVLIGSDWTAMSFSESPWSSEEFGIECLGECRRVLVVLAVK